MGELTRNYPLFDIGYVDNVASKTESIFEDFKGGVQVDFKELGRYKSKDWSFQHEKRYVLSVIPKHINSYKVSGMDKCILEQRFPSQNYIDIPMREESFEDMESVFRTISERIRVINSSQFNEYLFAQNRH